MLSLLSFSASAATAEQKGPIRAPIMICRNKIEMRLLIAPRYIIILGQKSECHNGHKIAEFSVDWPPHIDHFLDFAFRGTSIRTEYAKITAADRSQKRKWLFTATNGCSNPIFYFLTIANFINIYRYIRVLVTKQHISLYL